MRVVVLGGGPSSEHEVSVRSAAAVAEGLRTAGHDVVEVRVERDGSWAAAGGEVVLRPGGGLLGADAAFPVMHGPYGEDGIVQGVLDALDIPYVGSGVLASAVAIDKLTLKRLLSHHGIPQVDFVAAGARGWRERAEGFGLPLWVKPSRLGSSVGIARVDEIEALDAALAEAARHDPRVIVEAHADGDEVECGVIGNAEPEVSLPGQVVARGEWYDYESKYSEGGMDLIVPAPLDEPLATRARELAAEAYRATGCAGMARCDLFLCGGELLVNELNTIPGFTDASVFPKLWEASGVPYPALLDRLVTLAVERFEAERGYEY